MATGDATATQIASRPRRKLAARHTGIGAAEAVCRCSQPRRYTAAANTIVAVQPACAYGDIVAYGCLVATSRAASRAGGCPAGCSVSIKATRAVVSGGLRFLP